MEGGSSSVGEKVVSDSDADYNVDMQKFVKEQRVMRLIGRNVLVESRDSGGVDSTIDQACQNIDQRMDRRVIEYVISQLEICILGCKIRPVMWKYPDSQEFRRTV